MVYELSLEASAKMFLHAAKHPCNAVNGVLIGYDEISTGNTHIIDCIPLFHCNINLQPMAEAGLYMVDHYCQSISSQSSSSDGDKSRVHIVGYYFGPELQHLKVEPSKGNVLGLRMSEKIAENREGGRSCLFVLGNELPISDSLHHNFRLFLSSNNSNNDSSGGGGGTIEWTAAKGGDIRCLDSDSGTAAGTAVIALLCGRTQQQLIDLEDHLADITLNPDWTNSGLNSIIQQT